MRRLFQSVLNHIQSRVTARVSKRVRPQRPDRSLRLESLEGRRVLATVTGFAPTASGFNVQLSEQVDTSKLNLYVTEGGAMGAADVTLTGATTGNVKGSLVVDGTNLRFVATGGALPADTYTVTLRSAADGFTDLADGGLLDGESNSTLPSGNGTPGGNFVTTFTVASSQQLVVGLPDFARGPSQPVNVPAVGSGTALPTGLPIALNNAAGVTSLTLTLQYNSALLNITDAQVGSDAPTGSQVQANFSTPGQVTISFFSLQPLAAGQADLINLIATVPEGATYGATGLLRFSSVEVNAGAVSAVADDAIHVVAFPGDANANRRYDAEDARLIARVGVGLDSGFVLNQPTSQTLTSTTQLYPLVDAVIIGDVTGVDGLSPLDASDVLRRVVGLATPNLPALPTAQTPTNINLSNSTISPSATVGTQVGTFTTSDPDASDTFTYSLVTGTGSTDNTAFSISGDRLLTAAGFSASQSNYSIRVRVTDSTNRTFEKVFAITTSNANTAPTALALSSTTVAENVASGTTIGTFTTTDSNTSDTHTYSIVSVDGVNGSGPFAISGNSLRTAGSLNFETKASYVVRVRTTDQAGLNFERDFTVTVTNVNEAPASLALSPTSVADGAVSGTTVGTLTATDPDASSSFTFTLVPGTGATDNAAFSIDGNQLKTAATMNFTSRTSYSVRIRVTDAGGLSTEQVFTVTESGENAAPQSIALSSSTIAESAVSGATVGTFTTTDPDTGNTFTYTLVSGTGSTDNASFTIVNNELRTATALNFETKSSYSVRVRSTDGGGLSTEQVFVISVTNSNEAPTAIALDNSDVDENVASGTVVGTLSTTDPDSNQTFTYSLVSGTGSTDNAAFTINGNQLVTNTTFDAATKSAYSIRIRSTDAGGLSTEQVLAITINNVNQAPTAMSLSASAVAENAPSGTTVGTFATVDPDTGDTTFTYSLVSGTGSEDNASFTISGNTLRTAASFDFETKPSYTIRVRSADAGGLAFVRTFTVNVTNVNEAATSVSLSNLMLADGAASGSVVGTLGNNDPDAGDTFTYSLIAGAGSTDNTSFTIVNNQLRTNFVADGDTKGTYNVRVQATDATGLSAAAAFVITVTAGNVAPTAIALNNSSVNENLPAGTLIGNLSTSDGNVGDTFTYQLVPGDGATDNAAFTIDGSQLRTTGSFDFESKSSYSVRIRSTDAGGLSFEQALTISVQDINEPATAITVSTPSIAENNVIGAVVGTLASADPDFGDSATYSLIAGAGDTDNASFTLVGNELRATQAFDFETKNSYSIRLRTTDQGNASFDQVVVVAVTNVNEAPGTLTLNSTAISDGAPIGTVVGTLNSSDPDANDTLSFDLIAGTGDDDNASFTVVGNELRTAFVANQATKASYSIRARVRDLGGESNVQVFTVTVNPAQNVAPTDVLLGNSQINENVASGSIVGTLSSTDTNLGDSFSYSLVTGPGDTDNNAFSIEGDQLRINANVDFETKASYSIRVRSTDLGLLSRDQVFVLTVNDLNEAPTAIALSNSSVMENAAVGTVVGTLSTDDQDSGDTHTFALVAGDGDSGNAAFTIVNNELRTTTAFNFESQSSYSIRLRSTDEARASFDQVLAISIVDVNEPATSITLSGLTLLDGAGSGTTVGTFGNTDPDNGDTFVYSLVEGSGSADNGSFAIVGNSLQSAFVADRAAKSQYSIRVQVADLDGATYQQSFVVNITEVNVAPNALTLSAATIAENSAAGTAIGTFMTADDNAGDSFIYDLVAGSGDDDNESFTIEGNELRAAESFDLEMKPSYSIRVRTTDSGNQSLIQVFTITVTNVNEPPTAIQLSNGSIAENSALGTVVGNLSAADPDSGDSIDFELVPGTGDEDNEQFEIEGNQLKTSTALDFEMKAQYSVRVRATDLLGATVDQVLLISVTNINEAPTGLALDVTEVASGEPAGTIVGAFMTTDPDVEDGFTYQLVAGDGVNDNEQFDIVDGKLVTAASFDEAIESMYSVRVRTTDSAGNSFDQTITVDVSEPNVAPTGLALSDPDIAAGSPIGTLVGTFTALDDNTLDDHQFELVMGDGDDDNALFEVVGGELRIVDDIDYDNVTSLNIRVRTTDRYGQFSDEMLTLNVI